MENSSKLKVVGLTLAGLSVLASGSALAASLKVGGSVQSDFVWFDDDVEHPSIAQGFGAGNHSFDNGSNVTGADVVLRGTLVDRWVYNLTVNHNFRTARGSDDNTNVNEPRRGGPAVLDAWVGWDKYDPFVRFSVGRQNVSQGLENTGNRSAYTFIAPAAGQRSFATGRADGLSLEGNPFKWLGYQAGLYFVTTNTSETGAAPGTGANIDTTSQVVVSNAGNHLSAWNGRLFLQPVVQPGKVLHVGGTYSMVDTDGDVSLNAAPGGYFNNANAQLLRLSTANGAAIARDVTTGNGTSRTDGYTLWGVEGLGVWGPFHVQAEYQDFEVDVANGAKNAVAAGLNTVKNNANSAAVSSVEASGWYVQGSWMLTGESRNYDPVSGTLGKVNPRNSQWGAWEVAFRYDQVNFNDTVDVTGAAAGAAGAATLFCGDVGAAADAGCTNGGEMTDWTVGVNWYPNKNVKFMFNYTSAEADYAKDATTGNGPNFNSSDRVGHTSNTREVNVWAFKGQVDF